MKKENFLTSNQFFLFCICSICNNCNDDNLIVYFNVNRFFISVEICIIVQECDATKSHSSKAAGHTNKKVPAKKPGLFLGEKNLLLIIAMNKESIAKLTLLCKQIVNTMQLLY
jgi:hypothetical protein